MNITPVNFGKKIPLTQCKIRDNRLGTFIPATFYEIDCKDMKDINEISEMPGFWGFKKTIAAKMEDIHDYMETNEKNHNPYGFYIMQKEDGEIVGITEVKKEAPDLNLEYIESENQGKYKYVGQSMIVALGKVAKKEKLKRIYIPVPVDTAVSFYKWKCGFKECKDSYALAMKTKKVNKLMKKVQSLTSAPIMDLKG